jgi:predicted TIM-barrel fold metal-dependent hydrolase
LTIDAYSHACPAELIDEVMAAAPSAEAGALKNSYLWDTDRRLRLMDKLGIDMQVLVLVRPPMWLGMDRRTMHRLTRIANDGLAAMAATHPDRFVSIGVLPAMDDVLLTEVQRIDEELGLPGVLIFTNVEGKPVDDESMWPLYAEAAARRMPIWIHPQHGQSYPWLKKDLLDRLFGWPFETTLAMARLVYGGVLERYPDLVFVTHHLGGMIPHYAERADAMTPESARHAGSTGAPSAELSGPASSYFRKFYNDTMVSGSSSALRCGLEFFGTERVMYGTDFPMGPRDGELWPGKILDSIRGLELEPADSDLILHGNITRLLHRS